MQYVVQKKGFRVVPIIVLVALLGLALVAAVMNVSAFPPSNFMESGSAGGDENVRADDAAPGFDWANDGISPPTNTCPAAETGFTVVNLSGDGGLFNCGQANGQFTTPIAPIPTANGTVGTNNIDAIAFKVDPLSSDRDTCGDPQTQDGDPTVYTGAGGEKNGDSLVIDATGSNAVETWSTASVPPKDDISNVYAVSRTGFNDLDPLLTQPNTLGKELFFGAERVVNNGDTHMDFEFLQAGVSLQPGEPPATCAGDFDGHRTHGDFVASIDYTRGGGLGTFSLAVWHCNLDTHSADNSTGWVTDTLANPNSLNGTACDFAAGTGASAGSGVQFGSGPHYQEVLCIDKDPNDNVTCPPISFPNSEGAAGSAVCSDGIDNDSDTVIDDCPPPTDAVRAVTNGGGPVPCGGWACRLSDGTTPTGPIGGCTAPEGCINTNQLMEGGINLRSLGFTGCISTFIPHTRSSGSFTATLKDFELIPFNTCTGAIKIVKQDASSPTPNLLPGACFSVSPGSLEVCDNQASGTNVPGSSPPRNTTAADEDPDVGELCIDGLGSGVYTVTETVVPAGYIGPASSGTATVPSPLTTNVVCPSGPTGGAVVTFTNTLGSIQWEKRSDVTGNLQSGATFNISPNPYSCHVPAGSNPSPISDDADGTDGPAGPGDEDGTGGQLKLDNVCVGTYTITEASPPSGFAKDPDDTRSVTVSAAEPNPVIGAQDTADSCPDGGNDGAGNTDGDEEDFCNVVGSLFWEKRAKDASCTSGCPPLLGGATFKLNKNPHTGAAGDFTGITDCTSTPCAGEDKDPDAGQFCLDAVLFDTYTITETAAPANYVKDDTPKTGVVVNSSSTCAGTPTDAGDFLNTPLSEIEVIFRSLAGGVPIAGAAVESACDGLNSDPADDSVVDDGCTVTKAQIVCSDATPETADNGGVIPGDIIGEDGAADTTPPTLDDYNEVFTALAPDTYTCTIVIDP